MKFSISRYLWKLEHFNNIGAMHCFKFKDFRNNTWMFMHSKTSKKYCSMDNLTGFVSWRSVFILPVAAWPEETALCTVVSHLTPAQWRLWCYTHQLCQPSPAASGAAHADNDGCCFLPAPTQTREIAPWESRQHMFIFTISCWYRMRANAKQVGKTWEAILPCHIFPIFFLNSW